jgi:hypothetical protein
MTVKKRSRAVHPIALIHRGIYVDISPIRLVIARQNWSAIVVASGAAKRSPLNGVRPAAGFV